MMSWIDSDRVQQPLSIELCSVDIVTMLVLALCKEYNTLYFINVWLVSINGTCTSVHFCKSCDAIGIEV